MNLEAEKNYYTTKHSSEKVTDIDMFKEIKAPENAIKICQAVENASGQAFIVGGWVRDQLLGKNSKDIDLEVFGLTKTQLETALSDFGSKKEVGKAFGIYKIGDLDVALARIETKIGPKHTDFEVNTSPKYTPEQTSRRRDFTINALMYDPLRHKVLDFHQGREDLKGKILRAVDSQTFTEDPLRAYRLARLASQLGFEAEAETLKLCQGIIPELKHLDKERVSEEWKKILLSKNPRIGLEMLEKLKIIKTYFPEIDQMIGAPQDPVYHPEGDVWTHTLLALDEGTKQSKNIKNRFQIMLAILLHDIGKPIQAKRLPEGRISHHKHESREVAEPLIKAFLKRFIFSNTDQDELRKSVVNLICDHMTIIRLTKNIDSGHEVDRSLRRLSARLKPATLAELIAVGQADHEATKGVKDEFKGELLVKRSRELKILDNQPRPILTGHDLINVGYTPGPIFKTILSAAYNDQLDGKISSREEALKWLELYQRS